MEVKGVEVEEKKEGGREGGRSEKKAQLNNAEQRKDRFRKEQISNESSEG